MPVFTPEMWRDPYPVYRELRENDPVYWDIDTHAWILTKYDDVSHGLNNSNLTTQSLSDICNLSEEQLSSFHLEHLQPLLNFTSNTLLATDGKKHLKMRNIIGSTFSGHLKSVNIIQLIKEITKKNIHKHIHSQKIDIMTDISLPITAEVLMTLLGVPMDKMDLIHKHMLPLVSFLTNISRNIELTNKAAKAFQELNPFLNDLCENKTNSSKTLIDKLVETESLPNGLTRDEVLANIIVFLGGGIYPPAAMIGTVTHALLTDTTQLQFLRNNLSTTDKAADEFIRFSCPFQLTIRRAAADLTIRGKSLKKGDIVFLVLSAANRDPEKFKNPEKLDITRKNVKHLGFGNGPHHCMGSIMANLEASIIIRILFETIPSFKLTSPNVEYMENYAFRSPKSLLVEQIG